MAQFQNHDKLKAIEEKLEDMPTREEIGKIMQKLSDFDEFKNVVLSELKGKFVNNDICDTW